MSPLELFNKHTDNKNQYGKGFSDCQRIYEEKLKKIMEQLEQQREHAIDKAKANAKDNYMNSASSEMNKALGINLAIEIIKEEGLK